MSQKIRLGLLGATGRMGKALVDLLSSSSKESQIFDLVYSASSQVDAEFKKLPAAKVQVLVDFSSPQATLRASKIAGELGISMLVCTTGFAAAELQTLKTHLQKVTWAHTPNTSIGIFTLGQALRACLPNLPGDYQIKIIETHHKLKKDAPSGTALSLAQIIEDIRHQKVAIESIREGDVPGVHRIVISRGGESLEFVHRAEDRVLFAQGALDLAERLLQFSPRDNPYTSRDLFSSPKA